MGNTFGKHPDKYWSRLTKKNTKVNKKHLQSEEFLNFHSDHRLKGRSLSGIRFEHVVTEVLYDYGDDELHIFRGYVNNGEEDEDDCGLDNDSYMDMETDFHIERISPNLCHSSDGSFKGILRKTDSESDSSCVTVEKE
ncbi:hypothetical protein GUITHDRAFT_152202 [Guillardia theta CCMP2712]|uniref:Uncharacterized protein n=2 Tax=Guillardia theta TaxID=55529 RepID=L1JFG1_GUITC|nr:hypothetical protein GUITHDRAFT_152202 [Guillardia theta CCMP2712]EKX47241.1 hypothetical protein GUITHDRAFT_152202 [Guillardia theta CCMP2712]|mmetsp:Transcript_3162/g.10665  ORF Transcript_3162/g.10665 Transcript_3162/m.10665 type:complete len:138 (+) Transcript_3162:411-824(+)|eukprot:XP_005834221.1 hypothetical protein GUITHDRAFT_152202 [Guillardia theta CCMP2712]